MKVNFVNLPGQYKEIQDAIDKDVLDILHTCQFVGGSYLKRFENALEDYTGCKHVVGVGNGTDALRIVFSSLPGSLKRKKVLMPNNTFIATAYAAVQAGLEPVFVDVDPNTYLINIDSVRNHLAFRKGEFLAVVAVSLYGQRPDMAKLKDLCWAHGVYLIEDGAQSLGATFNKQHLGAYADAATTSFYPAKNLGTIGQGGAVLTDNTEIANYVRTWINQGAQKKYEHKILGGNSRLDTIKAAQLFHALGALDGWNKKRQEVAKIYDNAFEHRSPGKQVGSTHVYHLYEYRCDSPKHRDHVAIALTNADIAFGYHYPEALSETGLFGSATTPVCEALSERLISLPIHPCMTKEQANLVVEAVNSVEAE